MPIAGLSLAVVGVQFANANKKAPSRAFAIGLCRPGDPVHLVAEPKNPADPNAVMVLNEGGMQMGYLTAERAPWIGKMIREGREIVAIFQAPQERGAWIRVAFDGDQATLPDQKGAQVEVPAGKGDSDWWPDPIYPDE